VLESARLLVEVLRRTAWHGDLSAAR